MLMQALLYVKSDIWSPIVGQQDGSYGSLDVFLQIIAFVWSLYQTYCNIAMHIEEMNCQCGVQHGVSRW